MLERKSNMSTPNTSEAIAKYESFVNDVLKEDLRQIEFRLQQVNAEISDLIQLKQTLNVVTNKETNPRGFKTQVNLGCNFFMEASVTDTSSLLMNVGLNHYLEFGLEEAIKYLNIRVKAFEVKSEELRRKAAETKAHIKLMLFTIGELQSVSGHKQS